MGRARWGSREQGRPGSRWQSARSAGDDEFLADPRPVADPDHKYFDDGWAVDLDWHDSVPADVHPHHAVHVERFLE